MDELVLLVEVPDLRLVLAGTRIHIPDAVEPDCPDGAVGSEQLGELGIHKVEVVAPFAPVRTTGAQTCAPARIEVGAPPVKVGVIEVEPDALRGTFCSELAYHIASEGRRVHYIIGTRCGLEHREAVVVAGGDGDVSRAGGLDGRHPLARIEFRRKEASCKARIFLIINVFILHHPLSLAEHRVDAPVDKDAKAVPGETLAGFKISFGWDIVRLGGGTRAESRKYQKQQNNILHNGQD